MRHGVDRVAVLERRLVVPVVTTGLHCGGKNEAAMEAWAKGRPRRHDGAPLRPDRRESFSARVSSRPRRHDGAPLRRPRHARHRLRHLRVVPVVTTGLHCGAAIAPGFPVSIERRPRRHDGAPLRPTGRGPNRRMPRRSSPSSRRGSIAAQLAAELLWRQFGSSPSSRRGSIAAGPCPCPRPELHRFSGSSS